MTTIITGTSASNGFSASADTTGALIIQTGATPTTALTVSAAQIMSLAGPLSPKVPTVVSTTTYSQAILDSTLIFTFSGTTTITLLSAATYPGAILHLKSGTTSGTTTVTSASSNVVPLNSVTAGTAIIASSGKFTILQSDGSNWQIIAQV